jgi:hypothetical protein
MATQQFVSRCARTGWNGMQGMGVLGDVAMMFGAFIFLWARNA